MMKFFRSPLERKRRVRWHKRTHWAEAHLKKSQSLFLLMKLVNLAFDDIGAYGGSPSIHFYPRSNIICYLPTAIDLSLSHSITYIPKEDARLVLSVRKRCRMIVRKTLIEDRSSHQLFRYFRSWPLRSRSRSSSCMFNSI